MDGQYEIAPDVAYGTLRARALVSLREGSSSITEQMLQAVWNEQAFPQDALRTEEGHAIEVVSPGWWNRQEGPDFQGAQLRFNGQLQNGDVEVHLHLAGWRAHGHHVDKRYDQVILHVVYDGKCSGVTASTSEGRLVPTLRLAGLIAEPLGGEEGEPPFGAERGRCATLHESQGTGELRRFLELAGDWRILHKARGLGERIERVGGDQTIYEATLYSCGFSQFKHQFRAIAQALPYERAAQLAQRDPLLLEAALLQIAGLLPESLPAESNLPAHFERLHALRSGSLDGLRILFPNWTRVGVRPTNNPERRLAGVTRLVARTARPGLLESIMRVWHESETPLAQRRAFEALFPRPMLPRVLGTALVPKLNFRLQQGLLQMYQDWCEPNPSCRNCLALNYLHRHPDAAPAGEGDP
jgi:hypothetical protein